MTLTILIRAAALAALFAGGMTATASAQTAAADPHHPETMLTQAMPPSGMMGQGTTGEGMMGHRMMGMAGPAPMKIFFAIADANGDGGLSFDEVTAIHKRIFDRVDANKDGKAMPEEIQAFMRE
ncbi:EF-hand domain-containing protein [Microvirga sp. CF3016]|uniref:EF-hand domain-containing protein n=1 Tax=Microvirga sp. CF3016 TaxID=3110181 RepID=UPI002E7A36BC|nr:EF-hand domain-containing protein [Microvirga sp. CF3016]MEE1612894.1 EF-hand domain-containing protein [Microvirga sp. CF3016]